MATVKNNQNHTSGFFVPKKPVGSEETPSLVNSDLNEVTLEEVSNQAVITIRCLSSVPRDLQDLLAEVDQAQSL